MQRCLLHDDMAEGVAVTVGVVIAFLVAVIVGVMVWYKLNTAVFTGAGIIARSASNTAAQNATRAMQTGVWNTTNASANTIWTLFPIVGIVIIAGIILMIVTNFGKGQSI